LTGKLHTVDGAEVSAFTKNRLGRRDHDLLEVSPKGWFSDEKLIEKCRSGGVDMKELAEVGQVVLVCGKVNDCIHSVEGVPKSCRILDAPVNSLNTLGKIRRPDARLVHWFDECVQHPDGITPGDKEIDGVRSNEPGPAGHQYETTHDWFLTLDCAAH